MDNTKNYFYGIDFLRWFAAFGVVLYHYSLHFKVEEVNYSSFLNFLILNRDFAQQFVWLFWAISGFVFTNIYVHRETNLKNFFISRFARLYPLHFITLIIVRISVDFRGDWIDPKCVLKLFDILARIFTACLLTWVCL